MQLLNKNLDFSTKLRYVLGNSNGNLKKYFIILNLFLSHSKLVITWNCNIFTFFKFVYNIISNDDRW